MTGHHWSLTPVRLPARQACQATLTGSTSLRDRATASATSGPDLAETTSLLHHDVRGRASKTADHASHSQHPARRVGWPAQAPWLGGRALRGDAGPCSFFVMPPLGVLKSLSGTIGKWKEWTAKRILKSTGESAPLWQPEFFDHLLRSEESLAEKWAYVRENPTRGGLVAQAGDWPYAGSVDFACFAQIESIGRTKPRGQRPRLHPAGPYPSTNSSPFTLKVTVESSATSPPIRARASRVSRCRCRKRFNGRAPNTGS